MAGPLSNNQRKFLRRLAHGSPAAIQLGKNGLTPNFFKTFDATLANHELLKLRFVNLKDEKKELTAEIEAATGAILVSMVGHVAVYYRPSPDPEKRKLVLPRPGRDQVAIGI